MMRNFGITASILAATAAFAPSPASAQTMTLEVQESLVDGLLGEIGTFSGKTGTISVKVKVLWWEVTIAKDQVHWTMKDFDIQFNPGSITLTAKVDAKYDGYSVNNSPATATAQVVYDANKAVMKVTVDSVSVPFSISDWWGSYSDTLNVNPGISFEYPLGVARIIHGKQGGGSSQLTMGAQSLTPSVQTGKILFQGGVQAW